MTAITEIKTPELLPDPGFDPVNNAQDAARLEEFWLPSRPDPATQPELFAHWKEMFQLPLKFVEATTLGHPLGAAKKHLHSPMFRGLANKTESSGNWSGFYLSSRGGHRFCRVVGAWTVPGITPGVRQASGIGKPFQFSIWIGLDGKKRMSNSMPQVGTEHKIRINGVQEHSLWWQWWIRDDKDKPERPWKIESVKIEEGDRVLCSISTTDMNYVRIHVVNRTKGIFTTVQLKGALPFSGTTAEWVVERQSDVYIGRNFLYPVPAFDDVTFDHCVVETSPPSRRAPPWIPRHIRLIEVQKAQRRVAVISKPDRGAGTRKVRVKYHRPDFV